ncbi:MAG: uridine diphosphate-N-acetylglucosamine-binding protein YvcK [Fimbriimonadaceae bacterium]
MRTIRTRRNRFRRLLAPTAGLYRYVAAAVAGLLVFLLGAIVIFRTLLEPVYEDASGSWDAFLLRLGYGDTADTVTHVLGLVLVVLGFYVLVWGIKRFDKRVAEAVDPNARVGVMDAYARKQMLALGPRIVALGGGTGLSTLLRGLKQYSSNITAIVTVTDDGGSSGRLVTEMGMIPPGDIRNCLVALADAEKRMTDLFQHRFKQSSGVFSGHSIGNFLIAGFYEQTGDVDAALQMASEVLAIRGRVIPSTRSNVRLRALMSDGTEICGETAIVESGGPIRRVFLDPENVEPHPEALAAILAADLVVIGPGSVFTSVIPNLLVPGIAKAIEESNAMKAYVCNVMTQRGESEAFTAAEHVVALEANVDGRVCDYVLVNVMSPTAETAIRYHEHRQDAVEPDIERLRQMGYKPVTGDLMSETDYVRHDPARLANALMDLLNR